MPVSPRRQGSPFWRRASPYAVIEGEGNCLLNTGIDEMWDLIVGDSANHFNNASAQIGVGDSSTAATPTQTDLQAATNKTYKGMETGYPTSTSQKATFKASFGASEANYTWNEWVVKQASSGKCLNRKVDALGTKILWHLDAGGKHYLELKDGVMSTLYEYYNTGDDSEPCIQIQVPDIGCADFDADYGP